MADTETAPPTPPDTVEDDDGGGHEPWRSAAVQVWHHNGEHIDVDLSLDAAEPSPAQYVDAILRAAAGVCTVLGEDYSWALAARIDPHVR